MNELHSNRKKTIVKLNEDTELLIMQHSPCVELGCSTLKNKPPALYMLSLFYQDKTLNKRKSENVVYFISLVGKEVYDYLESLVSLNKEKHYNKGSGITYLGLSLMQVRQVLVLIYKDNKLFGAASD